MKRKEYEAKRKALMDAAEAFITAGKIDEANTKMAEVEQLDEDFENQIKAEAALSALRGPQVPVNMQNLTDLNANTAVAGAVSVEMVNMTGIAKPEEVVDHGSEIYLTAWAKTMKRNALTDEESKAFKMVNAAFTHTTENTSSVIPKSVTAGIWKEVGDLFPYWGDIAKTYVKGILVMTTGDTSSESKWYDEETPTEDGKEEFGEITFNGCELSRSITITWKLQEMAIEDFLPYIQTRMAEKMGAGLGYGVTHGKGQPGANDTFKPEPLGVITALEKQNGTPQIVTYAKGAMTYDTIVDARGKIKSGYGSGLNIYANSNTIWGVLAKIKDEDGHALFIPDPVNNDGVGRILGCQVKEDDSMLDGEVLLSNAKRGYSANVNKDISVMPEQHVKERKTDYCGYAIVDAKVISYKAHALLKEASVG